MKNSKKILKEEEEAPRGFSNEVKKHFLEIVSTYNKYQDQMDRKSDMVTIAETLGGIVEAAQQLAVNEAGDWFDKQTVKRNMGELAKLGKEFDKVATEANSLDQRLGGLYEDMGHILSRYYKLGDISENEMKTRLGVNESNIERYVSPAVASRNGEHPLGFSIFVKSKGYPVKELPKLYKTKPEAESALKKMGVNEAKKSKLMESAMSNLDVMAQEAPSVSVFVKNVYKEHPQLPKRRDTIDYLTKIFKDAKSRTQTESSDSYDEWRNTKIQAKNIFRMLDQKFKTIDDKKLGLQFLLKQNKTKDDQAKIMWQEFNKFYKIKESVNERKEFPSKEQLVAYMVKGGHNKDSAQRVVNQNYDYVQKHYQGWGMPAISDVLWTVNENFTPQDINMIKKVVDKEKKLLGLSQIFDKMGWYTDFVMIDSVPPHLKIRKKKNDKQYYLLVNKRYVDNPDWVSGEIAGGLDESVEKKNPIVNEGLNPGDKLQHKHNPNISIELVDTTKRGWKVKQFDKKGNHSKEKTAFYDDQDISGDRSIFKPINESFFGFKHTPDFKETFLNKLKSNDDIKKLADFYKKSTDEILKAIQPNIKIFKYNNGSPKKIELDFVDKASKIKVRQSEIFVNNESVNEEDTTDIITMDVPLFIRALEYAKEDAKTDMDLHDFAEKAIQLTKEKGTVSMDSYDTLIGSNTVTEAFHGYTTVTGGYMDKHKDEYKLAQQLFKKAGGQEIEFYDELEDLHTKLGHPKYMIWLSNALRGYKVDMYKDSKIKNKAEAEEALYILNK